SASRAIAVLGLRRAFRVARRLRSARRSLGHTMALSSSVGLAVWDPGSRQQTRCGRPLRHRTAAQPEDWRGLSVRHELEDNPADRHNKVSEEGLRHPAASLIVTRAKSAHPLAVLAGLAAASLAALALVPKIPQDQAYHLFADRRTLLGIPNFWNVA